jgi:hypothetical protein
MRAPINKGEIMSGDKKLSSTGMTIALMRRGIFPVFIRYSVTYWEIGFSHVSIINFCKI